MNAGSEPEGKGCDLGGPWDHIDPMQVVAQNQARDLSEINIVVGIILMEILLEPSISRLLVIPCFPVDRL